MQGDYARYIENFVRTRFPNWKIAFRNCGINGHTAQMGIPYLESDVLVWTPTLAIVNWGMNDGRRERGVQYYRDGIVPYVDKLRARGVRVVLCSVIPRGPRGGTGAMLPPNDGLQTWVAAARDVAARRHAVFVDLFTEAVDWPMINKPPTHYDPEHHRMSWELWAAQVHFEPAAESCLEVDAKAGVSKCRGATLSDLAIAGEALSFTVQNAAAVGPVLLKVTGLRGGLYAISVNGKVLATKRAEELVTGINLARCIQSQIGTSEFTRECSKGRQLVAAFSDIQAFKLPAYVKVPDLREQKQAAIAVADHAFKVHDETIRDLVRPRPLAIRITAAR